MTTPSIAPPTARREQFLEGRTALVTGGGRGIGAGVARRLAAHGATVVLTYSRSEEAAQRVVQEIAQRGGVAIAIEADAADVTAVGRSVEQAFDVAGRLDVLVNNAGGGRLDRLDDVTLEEIDWILGVNVRAMIVATKEALTRMTSGGRIVHIGSVNADRMPIAGGSVYSASKGAVAGFTRGLARELGPRGITVNNVQPGPVDTDLNPAHGPNALLMLENMASTRFGTIDEVGALVAFLVGPEAAFITGASFTIDGGFGA